MEVVFSERFKKSFPKTPPRVQKDFEKQLNNLLLDFRYPSLQTKKYNEALDIWQARVSRGWRFYFKIKENTYYLVDIMSHPK